jgi:hypothetical protein
VEDRLELRLPRLDEEPEFLRAHGATTAEVPNFLHYYEEGMPFGRPVMCHRRSSSRLVDEELSGA